MGGITNSCTGQFGLYGRILVRCTSFHPPYGNRWRRYSAWSRLPELDKEVDMASGLVKSMFAYARPESATQSTVLR